ncbi:glutathione S-transferase N-terminal domain-containing protein [Halostagnicola sp. A-GB9-2]|uniref:glutathione S-transferase N-terminal domain-containing protein n=1 Tax=Halostagnicola sp. A-GB9-2 TaxID=3048066 RepID=UPI0024C01DAC|nr:glutathione S-transferase N-terminal domain-containing protein [Halostagnicola sp. A-GB9-2]MDJ1431469.1 glutathione S-transferase N-terminal domain-containing protein [Halostagnicola sp. A-GB9-2]
MVELYSLRWCPYCAKVENKLESLDLDYERHTVSPFRFRRSDVKAVSGQSDVPVLVDSKNDVAGMAESDDIVDYLERTYG